MNEVAEDLEVSRVRTTVFISYSRQDLVWVDHLVQSLLQHQVEVLIDREDIVQGEAWKPRIFSLIEQVDTIVFVVSPASLNSQICFEEVAYAESLNKRLVPVVIYDPVDDEGNPLPVPDALARINFIFFNHGTDPEAAFTNLLNALLLDLEWLREHTRLNGLALKWEKDGAPASQLLRGADLNAAERWRDSYRKETDPPTELQLRFISQSRADSARRRRLLLTAVSAALTIAVGLGSLAWWQSGIANEQARIAFDRQKSVLLTNSRLLNQYAVLKLEKGDVTGALQIAAKALTLETDGGDRVFAPEALATLNQALNRPRELLRLTDGVQYDWALNRIVGRQVVGARFTVEGEIRVIERDVAEDGVSDEDRKYYLSSFRLEPMEGGGLKFASAGTPRNNDVSSEVELIRRACGSHSNGGGALGLCRGDVLDQGYPERTLKASRSTKTDSEELRVRSDYLNSAVEYRSKSHLDQDFPLQESTLGIPSFVTSVGFLGEKFQYVAGDQRVTFLFRGRKLSDVRLPYVEPMVKGNDPDMRLHAAFHGRYMLAVGPDEVLYLLGRPDLIEDGSLTHKEIDWPRLRMSLAQEHPSSGADQPAHQECSIDRLLKAEDNVSEQNVIAGYNSSPAGRLIGASQFKGVKTIIDLPSCQILLAFDNAIGNIVGASFLFDVERGIVAYGDVDAERGTNDLFHVWRIFDNADIAARFVTERLTRCLPLEDYEAIGQAEPDDFCIERKLVPYHTQQWRNWLESKRQAGQDNVVPMPKSEAWTKLVGGEANGETKVKLDVLAK